MEERRKSKRTELHSRLVIRRLDSQEEQEVIIEINDVSRTGVGFFENRQNRNDRWKFPLWSSVYRYAGDGCCQN